MKGKLKLKIIFLTTFFFKAQGVLDLSQYNEINYQDIWVNGKILATGQRDCAKRYEFIKEILNQYKRPITVLDIGASQGYFSFRIATEYPSVCVMIEGNFNFCHHVTDQLENLCEHNNLKNVIFLKKSLNISDLKYLKEHEHFDVVLALCVLHHMGDNWQEATDLILSLGDNVIVESPSNIDPTTKINPVVKPLHAYLQSKDFSKVEKTERNPLIPGLTANIYWFSNQNNSNNIMSNFYEKFTIDSFGNKTLYKPGITLGTFQKLNGIYPKTTPFHLLTN